ncbi:MAG: hypothetical protein KJ072_22040 [Verrucomicrobia bacterium]|nr:hypothetical protein [Verrucomicrobiota bacterium]
MKTLEWQNFFAVQREQHGKVMFSTAELANAARTTLHAVNTELGRLIKRGIVRRYAQGWYGPVQGVEVESILTALDPGAYATGFYALFRLSLVTQAPTETTCFTNRRHNRKINGNAWMGRLRFIHAPEGIYARPAGRALAPMEQALCDFVWLSLRERTDPLSLVTFRNLDALNRPRLEKVRRRYPQPVQFAIGRIVDPSPGG